MSEFEKGALRKGARVRVTYEGVVKQLTPGYVTICPDDFRQHWHQLSTETPQVESPSRVQIEVIAPPRREFEDGALYYNPIRDVVYKYHGANLDHFWSYNAKSILPRDRGHVVEEDLVKLAPTKG